MGEGSWLPGPGSHNRPARVRRPDQLGGGQSKQGCCAMAAAGRAARRGKYRLARRYAAMSVRLITARVIA